MIELSSITVQIGEATLVRGANLDIVPGRLTAVVGPNGAGKTTLLRVAAGDLTPSSGTVTMDGHRLRTLSPRQQARRRATLPQHSALRFAFPVLHVVRMGRMPHPGQSESEQDWAIAEAALDAVGMRAFAERSFPTLSGGEKQRVQLARALAQIWTPPDEGARYLLLDEPTASLDLAHQHQVLSVAADLARAGAGVLAVLHDLNLAAQYADRIVMLRNGTVRASGPPHDVFTCDAIQDVFGCAVRVLTHPTQPCPLVVPDGAASPAAATPSPSSFSSAPSSTHT